MRTVIVFAEGQTEEKFIKQIVAPSLKAIQVFVKPQLLKTSQNGRGGAITIDRVKFYARNTLKQNPGTVLSTFFDLYALDTDFPDYTKAMNQQDVYKRVALLETALHHVIVGEVGCRPDFFLPYIQPYEFEGLLFSNVDAFADVEPTWGTSLKDLRAVRNSVESPEHINNGQETKPSSRLEKLLHPAYKKTTHGPRTAERITLEVIERECSHFREWMNALRGLAQ